MADLKTNYVDDVLDSSKNQLRKYQQIQNDDGTVSFVDVTEYSTTGTSFGAKDINDTNKAVNELNNSLCELFKQEHVEIFAQALSYQQSLIVTKSYEPPIGYEVFGTELENAEASITVSGINYEKTNKRIALKYGCWYTGGSVGHNVIVKVFLVKKQ